MTINLEGKMDISVIVPIFNEAYNIEMLYKALVGVLEKICKYELIFVDDGSRDTSFGILSKIHEKDSNCKVVRLRKNFGQTAALDAGIKASSGKVIITIDGDLQNDPLDIPHLLEKIENGYDVVSGWRYKRNDSMARNFLSRSAYILRRIFLGNKIHDSGCTLKAYKRECFNNLNLYGEMHRFIPEILAWKGFIVGEVKVAHHPRRAGKTKYNLTRVIKGFLDLVVLRFWAQYSGRPIHLFGIMGIFLLLFGFVFGVYLSIIRFYYQIPLAGRPMLFLTVLLFIVGVQFIVFGILADIMIQVYYGSEGRQSYSIKEVLD